MMNSAKVLLVCVIFLQIWGTVAPMAWGVEKLKVVATIFPLGDIAAKVVGEFGEVKTLLPPGANPHTFEPRPSQVAAISRAQLFIKTGAGFDLWVGKFIAASGRRLKVVDASRGIALIGGTGEAHGRGDKSDVIRIGNPHFWLDPILCIKVVESITVALMELDPSRADFFRRNGEEYKAKLKALDAEIRDVTARFKTRKYVAFHSAWVYFSRRYGLEQAAVIEPFPGKEPSPRHLAKVVRRVREIKARAVFAEPQLNPKAAEVIAGEAGVKVLYLDPMGGLHLPYRDSYLKIMRYNLSVFKGALDG